MVGSRAAFLKRAMARLESMALKFESTFRLIGFGAIVATLLVAAPPVRAEDAQEAVQSAVDSDQIQHDRPLAERARESVGEVQKQPDIQHNPPTPQPDEAEPPASPISMDLSWLPYLILGAIGIALLFVLASYLKNRFSGRNSAAAKAAPPVFATSTVLAAPEIARDRTFDEVDALAEAGAFTEAVHRLLLLVQERLRSRVEHGLQVSLTSREILRRAKLSQEGSTAFATLVAAVEVSLFGMRAANAATYALCRENSRRVLAAVAE
jgi:hypothetical protein